MNRTACAAFFVLLSAPALCADLVITKAKHSDAATMMGRSIPAKDSTSVTWMGKDRMRNEEGTEVTIVRADQKKMYLLDTKAKTYSVLDMPVQIEKFIPEEMAPMMTSMFASMKMTVTPTTETKKVRDWTATKYTMSMTMPMGSSTQVVWATKDVAYDPAAFQQLKSAMMSLMPGGASMAEEWKKVEGFPVLTETTQTMMGTEIKATETVTSVESKEPAEGLYEVPKDFTLKEFDFMAEMEKKSPAAQGGN
jgi:hypothetical protein